MVFAYISTQGWVVDPYEHWFFDQPGDVLLLPTHFAKIFKCGSMTCGVIVVINWGGGFQMFFEPLSNVPADSPMCSSSHSNLSHLNL